MQSHVGMALSSLQSLVFLTLSRGCCSHTLYSQSLTSTPSWLSDKFLSTPCLHVADVCCSRLIGKMWLDVCHSLHSQLHSIIAAQSSTFKCRASLIKRRRPIKRWTNWREAASNAKWMMMEHDMSRPPTTHYIHRTAYYAQLDTHRPGLHQTLVMTSSHIHRYSKH